MDASPSWPVAAMATPIAASLGETAQEARAEAESLRSTLHLFGEEPRRSRSKLAAATVAPAPVLRPHCGAAAAARPAAVAVGRPRARSGSCRTASVSLRSVRNGGSSGRGASVCQGIGGAPRCGARAGRKLPQRSEPRIVAAAAAAAAEPAVSTAMSPAATNLAKELAERLTVLLGPHHPQPALLGGLLDGQQRLLGSPPASTRVFEAATCRQLASVPPQVARLAGACLRAWRRCALHGAGSATYTKRLSQAAAYQPPQDVAPLSSGGDSFFSGQPFRLGKGGLCASSSMAVLVRAHVLTHAVRWQRHCFDRWSGFIAGVHSKRPGRAPQRHAASEMWGSCLARWMESNSWALAQTFFHRWAGALVAVRLSELCAKVHQMQSWHEDRRIFEGRTERSRRVAAATTQTDVELVEEDKAVVRAGIAQASWLRARLGAWRMLAARTGQRRCALALSTAGLRSARTARGLLLCLRLWQMRVEASDHLRQLCAQRAAAAALARVDEAARRALLVSQARSLKRTCFQALRRQRWWYGPDLWHSGKRNKDYAVDALVALICLHEWGMAAQRTRWRQQLEEQDIAWQHGLRNVCSATSQESWLKWARSFALALRCISAWCESTRISLARPWAQTMLLFGYRPWRAQILASWRACWLAWCLATQSRRRKPCSEELSHCIWLSRRRAHRGAMERRCWRGWVELAAARGRRRQVVALSITSLGAIRTAGQVLVLVLAWRAATEREALEALTAAAQRWRPDGTLAVARPLFAREAAWEVVHRGTHPYEAMWLCWALGQARQLRRACLGVWVAWVRCSVCGRRALARHAESSQAALHLLICLHAWGKLVQVGRCVQQLPDNSPLGGR